jgi:hypothetical protein
MMKKIIIIIIASIILFGCGSGSIVRQSSIVNPIKETPAPINSNIQSAVTPVPESTTLPDKIDLSMPFYSQAPLANWDALHNDACEEAAALNVTHFLDGNKVDNNQIDQEIIRMVDWENNYWGMQYDLSIANVKEMVDVYFNNKYQTHIVENITIDEIKQSIALGAPVIVPLSGRTINNPNFTGLGPVYHMIVIRGYDDNKQEFITNEVGTRKGDGYRYNYNVLFDSMHDMPKWQQTKNMLDSDPSMIFAGAKSVLIITK